MNTILIVAGVVGLLIVLLGYCICLVGDDPREDEMDEAAIRGGLEER